MAAKKDMRRLDLGELTSLWVSPFSQNVVLLTSESQSPAIPYIDPPKNKDDADVSGTGLTP